MNASINRTERIKSLIASLPNLTNGQILWVESIVNQFNAYHDFKRNPRSDLLNNSIIEDFGDALRIHHCFSKEPFSKDKFEYVLEKVLNNNGIAAKLASKGNPGHDITIKAEKISLKTQADKSIKQDTIHISKFHELGKGDWSNKVKQLHGLRDQFLSHMKSYDRILTLRTLERPPENNWHYELVEIPKVLLSEAISGQFEMMHKSKQMPKPGYCRVFDANHEKKFELYFDGGTERKLQIKGLRKDLCFVHAEWLFLVKEL